MAKDVKLPAEETKVTGTEETPVPDPYADIEARIEEMLKKAEEKAASIIESAKATAEGGGHIPYEKRPEIIAEIKRGEEEVPVHLFKDTDKYKDDVYVSVGSDNILIKRGIDVKIKRKYKNIIEQSKKQNMDAMNYIESLAGKNVEYKG